MTRLHKEFLRSFLRRHFAGQAVVASRDVGSFLRLSWVIYERKCHTALDARIMAQRLYVRVTEINVERAKVRMIIDLNNVHKTFQPGANEGRKAPFEASL